MVTVPLPAACLLLPPLPAFALASSADTFRPLDGALGAGFFGADPPFISAQSASAAAFLASASACFGSTAGAAASDGSSAEGVADDAGAASSSSSSSVIPPPRFAPLAGFLAFFPAAPLAGGRLRLAPAGALPSPPTSHAMSSSKS